MTNKTILVSGATGLVGERLVIRLLESQHRVIVLTRNPDKAREQSTLPVEYIAWNPQKPLVLDANLKLDAVVHLAGEPVAGSRWTEARKKAIDESRRLGTRHLVDALETLKQKPSVFVSASAIGFYGDRGDEILSEDSAIGKGFLADVCRDWENETFKVSRFGIRSVALRIGIVLDPEGGALKQMLPIFRLGLGGNLGSGSHWMSWIHVDDLVKMLLFSVENSQVSGVYNAVSPEPVQNKEFTRSLSRALGRPALFPAPVAAIRLAFGEMASIVLASQRVSAQKIINAGFQFSYTKISDALNNLLNFEGAGAYRLRAVVWVPRDLDQVFSFFSSPDNLEEITPPLLNFKITKKTSDSVQEGMLIDYKLKVHGVPVYWRTRIESWSPNKEFVDRQLRGPYSLWVHRHSFSTVAQGTLVQDVVFYRMPIPVIGDLVHELMVKFDLKKIFSFRTRKIMEIFG